ncbi:MAG: ROK family protein, partial [Clostridia bacterium]|nr:ROK family protein [Clostridia bacterium]
MGAKLGVDIGGTNIKFAVVEGVNVKYKNIIDTAKTCEQIVEDISNEVLKLRKEYKIKAVGIGTPGKIKEGCVSAVNLPFDNFALDVEIAKKVGLPVNIDNDGNCAALGEVMMGGLTDCDNIVLVTLGTGVGGGIV